MATNPPRRRYVKPLLVLAVLGAAVCLYLSLRQSLSLEALALREKELLAIKEHHPWLVYAAAFVIYAAVIALPVPAAAGMSLVYAWFFGFVPAVILLSFASTAGDTLGFLASRYILRGFVERRFAARWPHFKQSLDREGAWYLFSLRLIPAVPPFVINLLAGVTSMGVWTFWWVSQLGMFPGTCVYVYAGANAPRIADLAAQGTRGILKPELLVALTALGLFPIVVRQLVKRLGARRDGPL